MMKEFKPELLELTFSETSDSLSGGERGQVNNPPQNPPQNPPKSGCWTIYTEWCNHNSGSHSELAIAGIHQGDHRGNIISMDFVISGFILGSIKDTSGYYATNVTTTGFTMVRRNHFNPSDNFRFVIQLTAQDSKYHGAIGATGENCTATVTCVSYKEG